MVPPERRLRTLLVALAMLGHTALARTPEETSVRFDLFADDLVWVTTGPVGVGAFLDVAAQPQAGGALVALDASEAVWWVPSPGRRWQRVLDAPKGALGDELSGTLDEQTDLAEITELEDVGDLTSATDDLQNFDDLQDALRLGEGGADALGVPTGNVYWLPDGRVAAARSDGLYVGDDLAVVWRRTLAKPVSGVAQVPLTGALLAATDTGLVELDGTPWVSELEGAAVLGLVSTSTHVVAFTRDGLWSSADGRRWEPRQTARRAMSVFADGETPDAWVGTDESVLRGNGSRGGFLAPIGQAPAHPRGMAFGAGGQVLAAAEDGAWVSRNRGDSWRPLSPGLVEFMSGGVALRDDGAWLAGADGLLTLRQVDAIQESLAANEPDWVPLETLVWSSANRVGVRAPQDLGGNARTMLRYILPQVEVSAWFTSRSGRDSTLDAGIDLQEFRDQGVWVDLVWRPPTAQTTLEALAFRGGDPQDADLAGSLGQAGAYIAQSSFANQQDAFALVTRLYRDRASIRRELQSADAAGRSLLDQVHLQLRMNEIEALLDAVTDGAVSRYNADTEDRR
jgi:hypothetical protein